MTNTPNTGGGSDHYRSTNAGRITATIADDERPSHAVVRAVATITNAPPLDLAPLCDATDPDHLNELFDDPTDAAASTELSFAYAGCEVTVVRDEIRVRVTDPDTV
ncbi:HalOD1 output domain-containing protein [Halovivax sp.]|uniref:HalOD1 output domain-containing protein n=1 Tax=Halovivax sp. TaxID=1935978 RepID=UPI0025C2CFE3|nr:HalOD1 output domain-containing protein [Halovivax sp.]